MSLQLIRADYNHPEWPQLAIHLNLDVHGGTGVGAIDPPHTLQRTDRRHNYRRFMSQPTTNEMSPILGIASFGLTLARSDILFVPEVFIPRDLRGGGYGRGLIGLIEAQGKSEGKTKILLQSLPESIGFYAKLGFEMVERNDDRPFMEKYLKASIQSPSSSSSP